MPKRSIESLGALVKEKRGHLKLRETAKNIEISPATLMRIENGHVPDLTTFGKICTWLDIDPGEFLGNPKATKVAKEKPLESIHLRADQMLSQKTAAALSEMIIAAVNMQIKDQKE